MERQTDQWEDFIKPEADWQYHEGFFCTCRKDIDDDVAPMVLSVPWCLRRATVLAL